MVRRRAGVIALCLVAALPLSAQIRQGGLVKADGSEATTGTVTTTGTLASGQVALGSGATSITGDAGCTWTGTGASFMLTATGGVYAGADKLGFVERDSSGIRLQDTAGVAKALYIAEGATNGVYLGTGGLTQGSATRIYFTNSTPYSGTPDLAISRASAGVLLAEDGSGNARDVQMRSLYFAGSNGTITAAASGYLSFIDYATGPSSAIYQFNGNHYPGADNAQDSGQPSPNRWRTGYFGTSLISPLYTSGPGKTGTNVAGTNNTIQAEPGTGSAAGASIVLQTPTAGASGTTAQTQTTRLTISEAGSVFVGDVTAPALLNVGTAVYFFGSSLLMYPTAATGDAGNAYTFTAADGTTFRQVKASSVLVAASGSTATQAEIKTDGSATFGGPVRLAGYTVATLPAGTVGDMAYVTDATAPTYLGTLTGGGAVTCPVMYNGAAWVSH